MAISRDIPKGSMREVFASIFDILRKDEELMRLLVYPSENVDEDILHPMDELLPNIVDDSEAYWEIVNKHIKMAQKSSDIEEDAMCRLYIYPGRRRPNYKAYILAKQEAVIDILMHDSYAGDMRVQWISDRINELLALEHIDGAIGKLDFVQGNDWVAPIGYVKYQLMYVFEANKK